MKVTKEKIENSQAFLTVEMEPSEMEESLKAAYGRLVLKAKIPGFRKGKAPRAVLERHLGREGLVQEAIKELVPEAYEKAVKEQSIEPFAQPEIEVTQADPLIFKATVPLPPKVELGDYHSIRLKPEQAETAPDSTDKVLEGLRHQHATWEPVERPIEFGDMAVLDIDSQVMETPFIKKLGAQYLVMRDAIAPAPGFGEQLVGMKKGEEKEFKLKLPESYARAELAGKEATFKVKVGEIKKEKLPELDDEFAKLVSPDFTSLALLKEGVTKDLKFRAEEKVRLDFEDKLVNAVVEQAKVEFPPVLVEMETNRLLNDWARQLQMSGRGLEEYLRSIKKTEEELRADLRPAATRNVTGSLVLGKVAETEKIEVSDAEIDAEIENMTKGVVEERKEEMRKMLNNPQMRLSIRQSMMTKKTMDQLAEIAKGPEETKTEVKEEKK